MDLITKLDELAKGSPKLSFEITGVIDGYCVSLETIDEIIGQDQKPTLKEAIKWTIKQYEEYKG
jgi:hypothetical protein